MRTVFLDRDGVINRKPAEGEYVTSWEELEILPGVPEALRLLNDAGFRVIVVTNQRGVARSALTEETLQAIHDRLLAELARAGARPDAIYYCPHAEGTCDCRKPGLGLFLRAKADFADIDFKDCFVLGDSDRDMEAGRRLGARVIRIGPGEGAGEPSAPSLAEAVTRYVLAVRPDHGAGC